MKPGSFKTKKQGNFKPYVPPPLKHTVPYDVLESRNHFLKDALDKANKRIEYLESRLKLFDERLLDEKLIKNDDYRNIYIQSIELKNERIEELEKKIEELSKLDDKVKHSNSIHQIH